MNTSSSDHPISEATRHIIDQLIAHGLKEGHDYPIEFAFFGDREALNRLKDHLVKAGFREDPSQSEEMLVLLHNTQLDYASIGEALASMQQLAEQFGVGFDGWSCSVN
jgi:regulator of RNase E activity RraB